MLARTAYATGPIQAALAAAGIAHRVLGSLGLYERAEVRDALAYLALLANPRDAHAFRRAVQAPRRGVGTATIGRLVAAARERFDGDLISASAAAHEPRRAAHPGRRTGSPRSAPASTRCVRPTGPAARSATSSSPRSRSTAASSPTTRRAATTPPAPSSAATASACSRTCARSAAPPRPTPSRSAPAASVTGFLEHAAGLHAEEIRPGEDRRITVSTIHRAKGTEAQLVLLLGCEEQLLPSWRSLQSPDPEDLEEERRLFYVAATRAKDHLVLTRCHVRGGRATGGPSRFLAEAGLDLGRRALAA